MLLRHLFILLMIIWHIFNAGAEMVEWPLNVFSMILNYNCLRELFNKVQNPKIVPEDVFLWININN